MKLNHLLKFSCVRHFCKFYDRTDGTACTALHFRSVVCRMIRTTHEWRLIFFQRRVHYLTLCYSVNTINPVTLKVTNIFTHAYFLVLLYNLKYSSNARKLNILSISFQSSLHDVKWQFRYGHGKSSNLKIYRNFCSEEFNVWEETKFVLILLQFCTLQALKLPVDFLQMAVIFDGGGGGNKDSFLLTSTWNLCFHYLMNTGNRAIYGLCRRNMFNCKPFHYNSVMNVIFFFLEWAPTIQKTLKMGHAYK
jgi:hypothetical protein